MLKSSSSISLRSRSMSFPRFYNCWSGVSTLGSCPRSWSQLLHMCQRMYDDPCHTLNTVFQKAESSWIDKFDSHCLPFLWNSAKSIDSLFPRGLERMEPQSTGEAKTIKLERRQISSLLANMLLGVTKSDLGIQYWANFQPWLCVDADVLEAHSDDPRIAYTTSLLNYFVYMSEQTDISGEFVEFRRVSGDEDIVDSPEWKNIYVNVDCVKFFSEGLIGDKPGKEVEIDFANKCIGFGKTATQEEIIFGCSPELCVAPLFIPELKENEAVLIRGVYKICDSQGYGTRLTCSPRVSHNYDVTKRTVLCIDALDFGEMIDMNTSEDNLLEEQLKPANLARELNKLIAAFQIAPDEMPIATGKWGCGAFGGDPGLKLLLQIIALSACKKTNLLHYYKVDQNPEAFMKCLSGYNLHELYSLLTKAHLSQVRQLINME